jgi:hypothetical protein
LLSRSVESLGVAFGFEDVRRCRETKYCLYVLEPLLHKRGITVLFRLDHTIIPLIPLPLQSTIINSSQPTMPQNKAAWITSPGAHPFVVKEAPYPSAGPGEVVIKNAAIAIVCHCPVLGNIVLKFNVHRTPWNGRSNTTAMNTNTYTTTRSSSVQTALVQSKMSVKG